LASDGASQACGGLYLNADAYANGLSAGGNFLTSLLCAGFCGHLDCPEYSVWQRNFDFEVRDYREGQFPDAAHSVPDPL
jgi:hypothetical protein